MNDSKIAIISDVHSNYQALQAVLTHANHQGATNLWFLGDAVGYGPDPHRCLGLLKRSINTNDSWILGNHDEAISYEPKSYKFWDSVQCNENPGLNTQTDPLFQCIGKNPSTHQAFQVNIEILDALTDMRDFLFTRPSTSRIDDNILLVHGGLRSGTPTTTYINDHVHVYEEFWMSIYKITEKVLHRLSSASIADDIIASLEKLKDIEIIGEQNFLSRVKNAGGSEPTGEFRSIILEKAFQTNRKRFINPSVNICFYGHTHRPACYSALKKSEKTQFSSQELENGKKLTLNNNRVWFLNPGSVGQPRDGDRRASYLLFDKKEQSVQLHRVEYNIRGVQKQMKRLGISENLIARLNNGR